MKNGDLGFWHVTEDPANAALRAAPRLDRDHDVDVVIVGGGYTGLWSALEIAHRDPHASILVLEAEEFGYGASGRNGGWLSAKPVGRRDILARSGRDAVIETEARLRREMLAIPRMLADAGHDIDAHHGGSLMIARSASEMARCRASVATSRRWGLGEDRVRMLDADSLDARIRMAGALGAVWNADMVRINPLKLVAGLCAMADAARVVRRTHARVTHVEPGLVRAGDHVVQAERIVLATEGYTAALPGRGRDVLPLNSTMIATRRLSDDEWARIGWEGREGISGASHTYFYGQRTPDGRIVLGGRGKPYRWRSGVDDEGRVDAATIASLHALARELFPGIDVEPAFAWCGVLGVTRDWTPRVGVEANGRIVSVTGFAGQGVTAAKLGGDVAAALVTGSRDEDDMPWVRRAPRPWEPEPLRWIGANGLYRAYSVADALEHRSRRGRTSIIARVADAFAGR